MARLDGGEFVLLLEGNPDTTDTARIAQSTINAYAFFELHMHAGVREQIELQHDLRLVIDRNSLSLHYQPKVSTSRSAVTGVEALLRWQHPARGMLGPGVFVAVAERFGLINVLGDWVIQKVCQQMRVWLDQGLRIRVAINLLAHQLRLNGLVLRNEQTL